MALSMEGTAAELRLGYQVAAVLGAWSYRQTETGFEVEAAVASSNPVYLAKRPLALDLPHGRKTLRFHDVEIHDLGTRIKVRGSGSPEQR